MCAIFGAGNLSRFEILYEANRERGNFASSVVYVNYKAEKDPIIYKTEGDVNFNNVRDHDPASYYMLGHVQAPTSAQRDWTYETSHPFTTLSWMIFHNGVITNDEYIRRKYLPHILNPVDSSLIVNLIEMFENESGDTKRAPIKYIKQALEVLKGTFALSIVDTITSDIYLARVGSSLHYNDAGCFSTIGGKGYKELPEGTLVRLNQKDRKFKQVGKFKYKSPFLFI